MLCHICVSNILGFGQFSKSRGYKHYKYCGKGARKVSIYNHHCFGPLNHLYNDTCFVEYKTGFPVLVKICMGNAFDETKLREYGYDSVFRYFMGKSNLNPNVYGWSGHFKNGTKVKRQGILTLVINDDNKPTLNAWVL